MPPTVFYRLDLQSGGAALFSCEGVNAFILTDAERTLFQEIAAAMKKYERATRTEEPRAGRT